MRKTFLLLLTLVFTIPLFAQFTITPQGFCDPKTSKDYIVYDSPDTPQEVLFSRALAYITYSLKNTEANMELYSHNSDVIVLSKTIKGFVRKGIAVMDLKYQISIYFKDNKIRINAPDTYLSGSASGEFIFIGIAGKIWNQRYFYIYDLNGKIREQETKTALETYFNSRLCKGIVDAVRTNPIAVW